MLLPRVFQNDDSYRIMIIHLSKITTSNIMLEKIWMNTYSKWSSSFLFMKEYMITKQFNQVDVTITCFYPWCHIKSWCMFTPLVIISLRVLTIPSIMLIISKESSSSMIFSLLLPSLSHCHLQYLIARNSKQNIQIQEHDVYFFNLGFPWFFLEGRFLEFSSTNPKFLDLSFRYTIPRVLISFPRYYAIPPFLGFTMS